MQVSRSYDDRTARISLQISINVKKQENQNHDHDVNSTPQPSPNPQNVSRSNRASQHRLPGPSSVPAFGEAVFRPRAKHAQQQNEAATQETSQVSEIISIFDPCFECARAPPEESQATVSPGFHHLGAAKLHDGATRLKRHGCGPRFDAWRASALPAYGQISTGL